MNTRTMVWAVFFVAISSPCRRLQTRRGAQEGFTAVIALGFERAVRSSPSSAGGGTTRRACKAGKVRV